MKTNNIFSNLWLTTKKEAVENRRRILLFLGGWCAFSFILGAWMGYFGTGGGSGELFTYTFLAFLVTTFVTSLSFSDMKRLQGRISVLMTPATPLDKMLPRLIAQIVGSALIFFLGYLMLEGARILCCGIFNDIWPSFLSPLTLFKAEEDGGWLVALVIGLWLFTIAFFFLGSILWPRYSYLKTIVVGWALQMLLGIAIAIIAKCHIYITIESSDALVKSIIVMIYVATFALIYLSWLRLKKSTVLIGLFK